MNKEEMKAAVQLTEIIIEAAKLKATVEALQSENAFLRSLLELSKGPQRLRERLRARGVMR